MKSLDQGSLPPALDVEQTRAKALAEPCKDSFLKGSDNKACLYCRVFLDPPTTLNWNPIVLIWWYLESNRG